MLSKFCSKWYFYPISSKIACVYSARSGKFTPFVPVALECCSRSTGIIFPRCGNNIECDLTFLVVLIYASVVSAIISCLRCAERLILSMAPMYTQLMMADVPPLLMSGSG